MELYCNSKTQHTTVKHSQQLFEHTYTSNLYGLGTLTAASKPIQSRKQQNSLLWKSITACLHCCATMELRQSSIVASLRRRKNVVLVHFYVTGHRRHVATETITRNNINLHIIRMAYEKRDYAM
jgi:hypothetical protein